MEGKTATMNFNLSKSARQLESLPRPQFAFASIGLIILIGIVDHLTGPVTSLTILYLVPVAATAWVVGMTAGNAMAVLAALTWAIADRVGPYAEPRALIAYWDDLSILVVFILINIVLTILGNQMRREREVLQEVQRRLLPATLPQLSNFELAWRWEPVWTVAGDYYDVITRDGQCVICVADVSGKGMPAALIMSNVQATVRALTAEGMAPRRVIANLNEGLFERIRPGSFVTIFYGVLDTQTGDLTYTNAGHNPPLLRIPDGAMSRLEPTGPAVGVFPGAPYTEARVRIRGGDLLVLYSDGITEYENAEGEQFGDVRLRDVIGEIAARSAEEVCAAVFTRLKQFGGRMPYNDDVTLVVLRSSAAVATAAMAGTP